MQITEWKPVRVGLMGALTLITLAGAETPVSTSAKWVKGKPVSLVLDKAESQRKVNGAEGMDLAVRIVDVSCVLARLGPEVEVELLKRGIPPEAWISRLVGIHVPGLGNQDPKLPDRGGIPLLPGDPSTGLPLQGKKGVKDWMTEKWRPGLTGLLGRLGFDGPRISGCLASPTDCSKTAEELLKQAGLQTGVPGKGSDQRGGPPSFDGSRPVGNPRLMAGASAKTASDKVVGVVKDIWDTVRKEIVKVGSYGVGGDDEDTPNAVLGVRGYEAPEGGSITHVDHDSPFWTLLVYSGQTWRRFNSGMPMPVYPGFEPTSARTKMPQDLKTPGMEKPKHGKGDQDPPPEGGKSGGTNVQPSQVREKVDPSKGLGGDGIAGEPATPAKTKVGPPSPKVPISDPKPKPHGGKP